MIKMLAQQFTYGYHPDFSSYDVKSWSEERLRHIGKELCEKLELRELKSREQAYCLMELGKDEVAFLFFKWGVKDNIGRDGLYCHALILKNEDYNRIGSHPRLLEKYLLKEKERYEEHVRKAWLEHKGRVEPLQIEETVEGDELLSRVGRIKDFLPSKDALKQIVSSLLKRQKLIVCGEEDNGLLKLVYLFLDLLPPSSRIIPFSTMPVRSHEQFSLIACNMAGRAGWKKVDLRQTISFTPQDIIDEVMDYVIDRYFEDFHLIERFHEKWEELRKKLQNTQDPFKIAEEYYREIILEELSLGELVERINNSIKDEKWGKAGIEEEVLWNKLVKSGEERIAHIRPASKVSITLIRKQVRKIDDFLNFINLLPLKERVELYVELIKALPDKSALLSAVLKKVDVNDILAYLKEKPEDYIYIIPFIGLDAIEKIISAEVFTDIPDEIGLNIFTLYFKEVGPKDVGKGLEDFENSILYKALLFLYKKRDKLDIVKANELLSNIVKKLEPDPRILLTPAYLLLLIHLALNHKKKENVKKVKDILSASLKDLFEKFYYLPVSDTAGKFLEKLAS
jgi:hypothetical protein